MYTDSRIQSERGDLDAVAQRVRADDADHGAKTTGPSHTILVGAVRIIEWLKSYPRTDKDDAHAQLNAVVLLTGGDYLEVDYADDPGAYSPEDASRAVTAVVTSIRLQR